MGLTSHLSCVYATFFSFCVSCSLMMSLMMMFLGPGHLVLAIFHFPLKVLLVVPVAKNPLVMSVYYFPLVVSVEYFQWIESQNTLVVTVKYFSSVVSVEYFHLVKSAEYFQLVESQNYFQLVKSQNYFRLKIIHSFKLRIFIIIAVRFSSLTLLAVTPEILCRDVNQLEWSVKTSALVTGAKTILSLSAVLTSDSCKYTNFGVLPWTGLLAEFILLLASMSETSPETSSRPTTWLKKLVESLFLAVDLLMRASNGSALLSPFTVIPGCLGLTVSWSLNCTGETEITTKLGPWKLNLEFVSEEEASLGVAPSLSVPPNFPGVRQIRAQLYATLVTFACRRTFWRVLKLSGAPYKLTVVNGAIGLTTTWMLGLFNNFCVKIPLVMWVSEILLVV